MTYDWWFYMDVFFSLPSSSNRRPTWKPSAPPSRDLGFPTVWLQLYKGFGCWTWAPFEGIKIFYHLQIGVGNSFSCLWDWNMLVARRIKGVFHDSNYLQHSEYLSTPPKRFKSKYPIQQGFPKDSQDYLLFFPPPNKETFLQGFFCSDRSEQEATVLVGGEFVHGARCQFVESLLFVRIHPFPSIHFCFFSAETLMV